MTQVFGNFVEMEEFKQEYLVIGFSPTSIPLQQRWRNNGLSADFLADYLSTFFPGEDAESLEQQTEVKDAVSYIANELLENAMKFNHLPSQYSVSITMQLDQDNLRFYVTNSLDPASLPAFQRFIQTLLQEDTSELYAKKLMQNFADEPTSVSGLGFLTMINNYGAELAWKFGSPPAYPNVNIVTTMVRLPL